MAKKKPILNPKRPSQKAPVISKEEEKFIAGEETVIEEKKPTIQKQKNKGYPISMSPDFYEAVKAFSKEFPEQGTVSSIFVRGASMLMREIRKQNA